MINTHPPHSPPNAPPPSSLPTAPYHLTSPPPSPPTAHCCSFLPGLEIVPLLPSGQTGEFPRASIYCQGWALVAAGGVEQGKECQDEDEDEDEDEDIR